MKYYLTYEEFGAIGDGVTDDFDAIIACHNEANRTGTPVKVKDGAKYYIKKIATATVKTDVDFGTAEIIIDDVGVPIEKRGTPVFAVTSDYGKIAIDVKSFRKSQEKLEFEHEGNVYVRITNANKPIFIRKGLNKNAGTPTADSFIVDADGYIKNRVNYDFDEVTDAYYKCIDDEPITIKGGKFTTIANQAESLYNYHSRNIAINRSNVTVEDLTHLVVGELDHGAPYGGFISAGDCANVTVRNCLLTPRLIYWTPSKEPDKLVSMGSYDINFCYCLNCTITGIRQTVDIHNNKYWGIIHTKFCKNLLVENCIMSRYDAHEGVTDIVLRDCEFGHQRVNLIGYGEALLENCTVTGNCFFMLRPDYGSFWHGNVTLKNCTLNAYSASGGSALVFFAYNEGDHDFGYACAMPTVLTLENITINDERISPDKNVFILPWYDSFAITEKPYPYTTTKKVIIKNLKTSTGRKYRVTPYDEHYEGLEVIEE